jgi:hypothetical protein
MVEAPGNQGEGLIDQPQAIAHHGFDRLTHGEIPHFGVLMGGLINDVAYAECVEPASDKAEVIQDLTPVRGMVGHNNLL